MSIYCSMNAYASKILYQSNRNLFNYLSIFDMVSTRKSLTPTYKISTIMMFGTIY